MPIARLRLCLKLNPTTTMAVVYPAAPPIPKIFSKRGFGIFSLIGFMVILVCFLFNVPGPVVQN